MAQKFNYPYGSGGKTVTKQPAKEPQKMGGLPGMEPYDEDGAAVAHEHGPANQIALEHDHESGVHSVHSVHSDGHEHHSQHGSAEEAHEHAKKLAGVGSEEEPHDEEESEDDWDK